MDENGSEKKVMVAIDGSDCSNYALEWALENLGETIRNCHLIIFSAQQPIADYGLSFYSAIGAAPSDLMTSMEENRKKITMARLEKAKNICGQYEIVAEIMTEIGEPGEIICEVAKNLKISLLLIGSHNQGVIQRAFLGSVSNYCVHNAKCPVLVVRK